MSFEDPSKNLERKEESERRVEKLQDFIGKTAEKFKKEGLSVTGDCRIDLRAFLNIYSQKQIDKDEEEVREKQKKWYDNASPEEIKEKKKRETGEQLEKLKTIIFDKFLGNDFFVVRSSSYDDIKNGVDNVILDKKTGNLVCAFDEVGETSGKRYEKKKREILEKNEEESGGKLKYGIKISKEGKIELGQAENLPIFYLALSKGKIENGIDSLSEGRSDFEEKLFHFFRSSLESQINDLKLEENLSPQLEERISQFEKVLHDYHPSKD